MKFWAIVLTIIVLIFPSSAQSDGLVSRFPDNLGTKDLLAENPSYSVPSRDVDLENRALVRELDQIQEAINKFSQTKNIPWEAIVAMLLGIAGIFKIQDFIDKRWLRRPILNVSINLAPPDCHKIAMTNSQTGQFLYDTYYFRLRVGNLGNFQIEDLEVLAEELYRKQGRTYIKIDRFLPLNLKWAHQHLITMPKIQPELFKHCDLAHIVQQSRVNLEAFSLSRPNNSVLILDTSVQPNTGSNILLPGKYKLKLIFAANNLPPKVVWLKLEFDDVWDDNEENTLANNVRIKIFKS